jgi:predicted DNA-binding antitoxin AbrB/MazE fold protein
MPELFCGRSTALDGCAFLRIAFWLRAVYPFNMSCTVEAIYEQGVLRPLTALPLQERALVRLVIHVHGDPAPGGSDLERAEWLKQSELTLLQVWSNDEDDVCNALLTQ